MRVLHDHPHPLLKLKISIGHEHRPAVLLEVDALVIVFLCGLVWQCISRPDLTMRMWIGAAHDLTTVLEHLNPAIRLTQFFNLIAPHIDNRTDLRHRHFRQRQVVTRRKADHTAGTSLRLGP